MAKKNALNENQKSFCKALYKHKWNQTRAYLEVYPDCTLKAAEAASSRLLSLVKVRAYVKKLGEKFEKENIVTREEIVADLKEVRDRCMQRESVKEYDHDTKEMVDTGEWQFKENGALKSIELLGKCIAIFTDKIEHDGEININIIKRIVDGKDS